MQDTLESKSSFGSSGNGSRRTRADERTETYVETAVNIHVEDMCS